MDRNTISTKVAVAVPPRGGETEPNAPPAPATGRTIALTVIAVIVVLFAVRMAAAFLIPLLLSVFLSYALTPVVARMAQHGVPRVLGAAIAVVLVVVILSAAVYRVANDATEVLEQIPAAVQRLRISVIDAQRLGAGPLENVKRAATELEKLASAASPAPATSAPRARAPAPDYWVDIRSMLLLGTSNVFIALGQILSALFLTFFLLAAGDSFRRKFVSAMGPSMARRKKALLILEDVNKLNQHYFAVVLGVNIAVGIATGLGLYAIGLERPMVWGLGAAVLHTIPYLGSALVGGAAALVAYGQFGTWEAALLAGSLPIVVAAILGIGLQTWLMGRAARMSSPAVFLSLMFWGMVWGGWGLLLAVPIMVAAKTACDHVERLKPVGAMFGP